MAKPFKKAWKYLMASVDNAVEEHADPKIQIQQAIEEHQSRHQALQQQAAAVIGNQRQLEMKLNRQLGEIEKLQASARQALVLSDRQRAAGDEAGAQRYEETAQVYASQLITGEQSLEDLKTLHGQAAAAAASAKQAVERNTMLLQQKMAERTKLLSQLEQANMAEQSAAALRQMTDTADSGAVPSLEGVRDKIERRYANAMGQAELAQNSVQGRMIEVQAATIDMAGQNRLEQIRASLRGTPVAPAAVTAGSEPDALPASAPTPATASNVSDLRAKLGVHTQNG